MKHVIRDDKEAQAALGDQECVALSFVQVAHPAQGLLVHVIRRGTFAECKAVAEAAESPGSIGPNNLIHRAWCGVMPSAQWDNEIKGDLVEIPGNNASLMMAPSDLSIVN